MATRARARTALSSLRVSCFPPARAAASRWLHRRSVVASSPSARLRDAPDAITRGPMRASIQRTSSGATYCQVPRNRWVRIKPAVGEGGLDRVLRCLRRAQPKRPQRGEVVLRLHGPEPRDDLRRRRETVARDQLPVQALRGDAHRSNVSRRKMTPPDSSGRAFRRGHAQAERHSNIWPRISALLRSREAHLAAVGLLKPLGAARDLGEAIQVAARIPGARWGSIEVRPVWRDLGVLDGAG